jgi:hypothetical protein
VVTYPNIIKPNAAAKEVVNLLDRLARQTSTRYLRLVRDNDQEKAVMAQPLAGFWNAGLDLDLVQSRRRVRPPIAHQGAI